MRIILAAIVVIIGANIGISAVNKVTQFQDARMTRLCESVSDHSYSEMCEDYRWVWQSTNLHTSTLLGVLFHGFSCILVISTKQTRLWSHSVPISPALSMHCAPLVTVRWSSPLVVVKPSSWSNMLVTWCSTDPAPSLSLLRASCSLISWAMSSCSTSAAHGHTSHTATAVKHTISLQLRATNLLFSITLREQQMSPALYSRLITLCAVL